MGYGDRGRTLTRSTQPTQEHLERGCMPWRKPSLYEGARRGRTRVTGTGQRAIGVEISGERGRLARIVADAGVSPVRRRLTAR